jgi:hypothetical protein
LLAAGAASVSNTKNVVSMAKKVVKKYTHRQNFAFRSQDMRSTIIEDSLTIQRNASFGLEYDSVGPGDFSDTDTLDCTPQLITQNLFLAVAVRREGSST